MELGTCDSYPCYYPGSEKDTESDRTTLRISTSSSPSNRTIQSSHTLTIKTLSERFMILTFYDFKKCFCLNFDPIRIVRPML